MLKTLCVNYQEKGLRNVKEFKENKRERGAESSEKMKGEGKIKMSSCREGLLLEQQVVAILFFGPLVCATPALEKA